MRFGAAVGGEIQIPARLQGAAAAPGGPAAHPKLIHHRSVRPAACSGKQFLDRRTRIDQLHGPLQRRHDFLVPVDAQGMAHRGV